MGLRRRLRHDRPDVILSFGWASPVARLGIAYSATTRTPLLYYGDSNSRTVAARWRVDSSRSRIALSISPGRGGALDRCFQPRVLPHAWFVGASDSSRCLPRGGGRFFVGGRKRQPRNIDGGKPLVVGFAGKFVPAKGVDDLIEAVALLPDGMSWELWLIGDGPLRAQLESLVDARGLTDRVRFLGFQNTDALPSLMASIDVMVMPSRKEPRGLVAVEAMAAGAATVVSSATGVWGPGDVLRHEETGLVFPAGDVRFLASCLHRLLEDSALRDRLASAGRERASAFGPDSFAATAAAALVCTARGRNDG